MRLKLFNLWVGLVIALSALMMASGCQSMEEPAEEESTEKELLEKEADSSTEEVFSPAITVPDSSTSPGEHVMLEITSFPYRPFEIAWKDDEAEGEVSRHWWDGETIYLLAGISYYHEPGEYPISLKVKYFDEDENIDEVELSTYVELSEREYPEQRFHVPEQRTEGWTQEKLEEQRAMMGEARQNSYSLPLGEGSFKHPVEEGNITSEYGAVRIINDNPPRRHAGLDLGGLPEGTPVKATQAGVVRLADSLLAPGKTVILDHGMGLNSSYLHLHEIKVDPGDMVEKGEVIGTLGQTGYATGPHLHWEIRLWELPLCPEQFLEAPPTWGRGS